MPPTRMARWSATANGEPAMPTPLLTVLICTHDRAALLARTIESLNAAELPAEGVQLLVVANRCNDGTHELLERYVAEWRDGGGRLPLRWIAEPTPGKSHALNRALPEVDTPLVAFVDDDHRVDAGYLSAVCRAADAHPDADLFCGRILPDWDGSEPAWVHDSGPYRIYPLPVPRFDQGDIPRELTPDQAVPGGGNLFLRTPWVARVGLFATDMGPTGHDLGGAEDLDWVMRALRLGARLHYVPDVLQHHFVDASRLKLTYIMEKAYKRTASIVRLEPQRAGGGVPRYLYRKIAEYGVMACTALGSARRRFYLVRTAAACGEFAGHLQARRAQITAASATTAPR